MLLPLIFSIDWNVVSVKHQCLWNLAVQSLSCRVSYCPAHACLISHLNLHSSLGFMSLKMTGAFCITYITEILSTEYFIWRYLLKKKKILPEIRRVYWRFEQKDFRKDGIMLRKFWTLKRAWRYHPQWLTLSWLCSEDKSLKLIIW